MRTRSAGLVTLLVGVLLAGGAGRLAYIQSTQGETLRQRAARQQTTTRIIPAVRGEIIDTRGRVLAGTILRPSVYVDPYLVQDARYAAESVAPYLKLSPDALYNLLVENRERRFAWLARTLEVENETDFVRDFEAFLRARRLRAFGVPYEPVRVYAQGRVAPHVIGFVGADLQGLAGIEQGCQDILAGRPGRATSTVDVSRRRVRAESLEPAEDGGSVVLTLDAYIQQVTQDKLRAAVEKYAADWGAVVVMDPHTGEVLAMAVVPDFDPSSPLPKGFNEMSPEQQLKAAEIWRNRAVSDSYEPGSIFKPFIASQALDEGLTRIDEVFVINGPVRSFGKRTIRDTHPYGQLALHEVISKSSNIGMGLLGARCRMDRLFRYVRMFGFGDVTGLGLPGEHEGQVRDLADWNPSFSPQSIPIGQELAVTPIQVVTAFSAFCNGGVLLRPRIIRGVISPDGQTLRDDSTPIPIRRVISAETSELFRRAALVEAVRTGTGKMAALEDWQVFGKTGTAQIAGLQGKGYGGGYVASFVGGAPAGRPRVVAVCSIYRPTRGGYYGGVVAAPVVKEILAETLAYMQVPPELSAGDRKSGAAGRKPPQPSAGERRQDVDAVGD
ncbi:MAG: penicillin-binding protein 2 [Phycisphaerales bacterium]|nr:penicillin-binding protein 2 [Phycisphaerales bacterium]